MKLKETLRRIHPNARNPIHGRLLSDEVFDKPHHGTQMPLSGRPPQQSTVFQVKAILNGWRDLMMALRVVTSFRMTATMAALWGLPLALSLWRKAMNVGLRALADKGGHEEDVSQRFAASSDSGGMD
jgi:hypothetical protein